MLALDGGVVATMSAVSLVRSVFLRERPGAIWASAGLLVVVIGGSGALASAPAVIGDEPLFFDAAQAVGDDLSLLDEIHSPAVNLASGRRLVIFYRDGCVACHELLDQLETGPRPATAQALSPLLVKVVADRASENGMAGAWIRERPTYKIPTPTILELVDGRVIRVHEADDFQ